MRISARTKYGIRALIDIAMHDTEEPVPVGLLATRLGISKNFLENLLLILKRKDLVIPSRGPKGGYALARHPADISMAEVFIALEGTEHLACLSYSSNCPFSDYCTSRDLLEFLDKAMVNALSSVTLESMAKKQALKTPVCIL